VLYVPESRAPRASRTDPVGQLLVIVLLGASTYAVIEAPDQGWTSPPVTVCVIAAAGAPAALVPYESRRSEALIEPRLFRSAPFRGAVATAVLAFAALGGFLFANARRGRCGRGRRPGRRGWRTPVRSAGRAYAGPVGPAVGRRFAGDGRDAGAGEPSARGSQRPCRGSHLTVRSATPPVLARRRL
jgi:hypothetical protein